MSSKQKLGLIAGNGKFPFLILDAARAQGLDVVVAAIKEETSPEIETQRRCLRPLALARRTLQTDRNFPARRRPPRHHGRTGQAQTDFLQHQARLASRETPAFAEYAQHRLPARRRRESPRRRRHRPRKLHRLPRTAARQARRAHRAPTFRRRTEEYRLRPLGRAPPRAVRHRTNRGRRRSRLRCRRGHGRHRRDHRTSRRNSCVRSRAMPPPSAARSRS